MSMNTSLNLFDQMAIDFQDVEYTPPDVSLHRPLGWTWSCDSQGCYLSCSPEIREILGFAAEVFVGKTLADFALTPTSAATLKDALDEGGPSLEMRLEYVHADGTLIPVSMHMTQTYTETGEKNGWHGFALKLYSEEKHPAAPKKETPQPALHHVASSMILDILDNFKNTSPVIQQFPKNSVTFNELRETSFDNQGNIATAYPVIIEHKIKWGYKFDFDYDEDLFIRRSKFSTSGLRGYMERLSAPNNILKCDLRWIAVILEIDAAGTQIWVDHPQEEFKSRKIELNEFLENKDVLISEINRALERPWESVITYRIGVDYLINPETDVFGSRVVSKGQNGTHKQNRH